MPVHNSKTRKPGTICCKLEALLVLVMKLVSVTEMIMARGILSRLRATAIANAFGILLRKVEIKPIWPDEGNKIQRHATHTLRHAISFERLTKLHETTESLS